MLGVVADRREGKSVCVFVFVCVRERRGQRTNKETGQEEETNQEPNENQRTNRPTAANDATSNSPISGLNVSQNPSSSSSSAPWGKCMNDSRELSQRKREEAQKLESKG
jgi:hypothetical protein